MPRLRRGRRAPKAPLDLIGGLLRHVEERERDPGGGIAPAQIVHPFHEIGPSFSLRLRRDKLASLDLFKEACRKPKITNLAKKKAAKNKFTTDIGDVKGKVFIQN